MTRWITVVVAWLAMVAMPAVAHAEALVPQPDTPCRPDLAGTLAQLPDLDTLVQCSARPGRGYIWEVFADPYPNSDRWFTYGPKLTLHGEGQRNREINSGDWIATPQDAGSACRAEQVAIADTGSVGPPTVSTGEAGQPLNLRLPPLLFTIELSGHCLWQKS
jgi:hypothetical protein